MLGNSQMNDVAHSIPGIDKLTTMYILAFSMSEFTYQLNQIQQSIYYFTQSSKIHLTRKHNLGLHLVMKTHKICI